MKTATLAAAVCAAAFAALSTPTIADRDHDGPVPRNATFTTQAITPLAIEGLTADDAGNLYTTGRATLRAVCPVWQITGATLPWSATSRTPRPRRAIRRALHLTRMATCTLPTAARRRRSGSSRQMPSRLLVAVASQPACRERTGSAFDADGNLWTGDGVTGLGRVWRIQPAGGACEPAFSGCIEAFRIQPMANTAGVGRSNGTLQPGNPTPNPQPLVANGLAFTPNGDLYIADTARGAIWKVEFHRRGELRAAPAATPPSPPTRFAWTTSSSRIRSSKAPTASRSTARATSGTPPTSATPSCRSRRTATSIEVFRNPVDPATLEELQPNDAGNPAFSSCPRARCWSARSSAPPIRTATGATTRPTAPAR